MTDGGTVVPVSFEVMADRFLYTDTPFRRLLREQSWEERLSEAIERRRIRNRIRWAFLDYRERVALAVDVLRGRHECDP